MLFHFTAEVLHLAQLFQILFLHHLPASLLHPIEPGGRVLVVESAGLQLQQLNHHPCSLAADSTFRVPVGCRLCVQELLYLRRLVPDNISHPQRHVVLNILVESWLRSDTLDPWILFVCLLFWFCPFSKTSCLGSDEAWHLEMVFRFFFKLFVYARIFF